MVYLQNKEIRLLENVSKLLYCNPFLPERIDLEREILGTASEDVGSVWSAPPDDPNRPRKDPGKITKRVDKALQKIQRELSGGARLEGSNRRLYEDAVMWWLYHKYESRFFNLIPKGERGTHGPLRAPKVRRAPFFEEFTADWDKYLLSVSPEGVESTYGSAEHIFACFFQARRAFYHIFNFIIGPSLPTARLRASVWQSIFSCNMRRYWRSLYPNLGRFPTLITGPSGTGKDLVAQAIGFSRYVGFNRDQHVFPLSQQSIHSLNVSTLPTDLVESELFGYKQGSFTGATSDHDGWLSGCGELDVVFLDEIGELDVSVQVKILRVLETKKFRPLSSKTEEEFRGKIVAATNRDLFEAMKSGDFREDLYYRLCSDRIVAPSLQERFADSAEELRALLLAVAKADFGEEADDIAQEAEMWILKNLGVEYSWPGNVRELRQCVRNIAIRGEFAEPMKAVVDGGSLLDVLRSRLIRGEMSMDEVVAFYYTYVYHKSGRNYKRAGEVLGRDRRVVKKHVDSEILLHLSS